ncbi:MAG: hypothetical protein ACD_8C00057G0022 [uncultured bacterium]|nr:MAG: hypothetical protein ACD_8C00057G0022 [uncultured bacterium]
MNFPRGIMEAIRKSPDRGDNLSVPSGGPMKKLDVVVEDEKMEPDKERMEMINSSFAKIFDKDANKDVHIMVSKDGKESKRGMGSYLTTGLFDIGMLSKLKVMFIAASGKDEDLNEENIDSSIKKFFIENVDTLEGSNDMKRAIKAMCEKDSMDDEKLEEETNALWDELTAMSEEFEETIKEDTSAIFPTDETRSFFLEAKMKAEQLIGEINGRVAINGEEASISEYNEEVLNFFRSQVEKFKKFQVEYNKNKQKFAKAEVVSGVVVGSEKKDKTILSLKKHIENITKGEIKRIGEADTATLAPLDSFLKKLQVIKKGDLSEEDTVLFENYCAYGIREVEKAWNEKTQERKKAGEFRKAAVLVKHSDLSTEEFTDEVLKKYTTKRLVEIADFDISHRLLNYADVIEGHHVDSLGEDEVSEFWNNYQSFVDYVAQINDPKNPEKLIVIDGKTYSIDKELKEVEVGESAVIEDGSIENKKSEKERVFGIALGLAQEFMNKLTTVLEGGDDWKKLRKKYQESFLEGQVVAFVDELIEQEKIVSEDEKESFVEKILNELLVAKGENKIES